MPLIILGLLVVAGLLAYMYFTGHSESFIQKKKDRETDEAAKEDDSASVIYLPNDIEKEKRKRNVKTGK